MKTIILSLIIAAAILSSCTTSKHCYKGSDCSAFSKTIDDSVKHLNKSI